MMRMLIDDQVTMRILPTLGISYHHEINSEVKCHNRTEYQGIYKNLDVQIIEYNPMFFTVKITTKIIRIELDSVLKKQEDLTKSIYEVLENIEFRMNWKGELIQIVNHDDIIERWKEQKSKLKERYKGQAIERYLIGIEKKIQQHDKLLSDCLQYRLYGLLFNDLFGFHSSDPDETQNRIRTHGNMVYQLPLAICEKVKLLKTEKDKIILGITGDLNEEQIYADKIQSIFKRKNISDTNGIRLTDYNGEYIYDKETGVFDTVGLSIVTECGKEYRKIQNHKLKQQ